MGCNFYCDSGIHIGKRNAAGLYCWTCHKGYGSKTDMINLLVVVESTDNEYAEVVSAHVRRKTKGDVIGGGLIYDASSPSNRTGIQFQI